MGDAEARQVSMLLIQHKEAFCIILRKPLLDVSFKLCIE